MQKSFFNKKAQGTIEYLVIIGVVVVISLVVVSTLTGFLSGAEQISETNSNIYWRSAQPFAITETAFNSDSSILYIVFNGREAFNSFNIGMDQNDLGDTSFSSRSIVRQITLTDSLSQISQTNNLIIIPKELIHISYDSRYISDQAQLAQSDLIVRRMN